MMVAYIAMTREEATNQAKPDAYAKGAPATARGHRIPFLSLYEKQEILEGQPMEGAAVLPFPTFEEAKQWYEGAAYQKAAVHRLKGAEYHIFIVEGSD